MLQGVCQVNYRRVLSWLLVIGGIGKNPAAMLAAGGNAGMQHGIAETVFISCPRTPGCLVEDARCRFAHHRRRA
jgi:hypothetical protein